MADENPKPENPNPETPNPEGSRPEGPGAGPVSVLGIAVSLLLLVLLAVTCLYSLVAIWPHPTPSSVSKPETKLETPKPETPKPNTTTTGTATTGTTTTGTATTGTATTGTTTTGTTTTGTTTTGTTTTGTPTTGTTTTGTATTSTTPAATATADTAVKTPASAAGCKADATPEEKEDCCWARAEFLRTHYADKDGKVSKDDPTCVYLFGWHVLWGETRLLLIVMFCGFLGALIYSFRSFFWYAGNRNLVWSWLAMYLFVPVVGAMLAIVFYLVLRGGLFSPATSISDTSPFGFAAVAALVGMFTNQAAEKLRTVFETLMTKAQTGKDPSSRTVPVLASVAPTSVPHGQQATLSITGDHFYADSRVYANTSELATTFKNEKQLEAILPGAMIPNATADVAISVATPNAGKSSALKLTVT